MNKIRLLSCGLMAMAGLGTSPFRPVPAATTTTGFAAFFGPLLLARVAAAVPLAGMRKPSIKAPMYTVTATAYEAIAGQTDDEPFVTADNSRIPRGYSSRTRWLALSRDLLRPWGGPFEFGDKVQVTGMSPALDGVYTVHDTMNRRYRHRLDVLAHPREHLSLARPGVTLRRVASTVGRERSPRSRWRGPRLPSHRAAPRTWPHCPTKNTALPKSSLPLCQNARKSGLSPRYTTCPRPRSCVPSTKVSVSCGRAWLPVKPAA